MYTILLRYTLDFTRLSPPVIHGHNAAIYIHCVLWILKSRFARVLCGAQRVRKFKTTASARSWRRRNYERHKLSSRRVPTPRTSTNIIFGLLAVHAIASTNRVFDDSTIITWKRCTRIETSRKPIGTNGGVDTGRTVTRFKPPLSAFIFFAWRFNISNRRTPYIDSVLFLS